MNRPAKVKIRQLPTGVRGLDEILGGGLPEFSFNIIAGAPGSGKTTLAHQIIFANATPQKPALYFTVLGEPAIKMLRYQQQYSFFDAARLNKSIRFINLSNVVMEIMVVIKMRGGNHSKDIREYIIIDKGVVVIGPRQTDYARLTTGLPERIGQLKEAARKPTAKGQERIL